MSANFTPDQKGYKTYKSFGTFKLFVLENFPFITEDFDALTYYQMLCKVVGFLQDVITNNESLQYNQTELLDAFNELQNYVNHYFDNLDVQNEINNKLDKMAENGTLTNLIKKYVDPFIDEQNTKIDNINNKLNSLASGSPIPVSSTTEMTNTSKVYVNTTDGNWYYYNGTSWVVGGVYQATGVAGQSITYDKLNNNLFNNSLVYAKITKPYETDTPQFRNGAIVFIVDLRKLNLNIPTVISSKIECNFTSLNNHINNVYIKNVLRGYNGIKSALNASEAKAITPYNSIPISYESSITNDGNFIFAEILVYPTVDTNNIPFEYLVNNINIYINNNLILPDDIRVSNEVVGSVEILNICNTDNLPTILANTSTTFDNLFNKDDPNMLKENFLMNNTGVTSDNVKFNTVIIPLKANKTYFFKYNDTYSSTTTGAFVISSYDTINRILKGEELQQKDGGVIFTTKNTNCLLWKSYRKSITNVNDIILLQSDYDTGFHEFTKTGFIDNINGVPIRDNNSSKDSNKLKNLLVNKSYLVVGDSISDSRLTNYSTIHYYDFLRQNENMQIEMDGCNGTGYTMGYSTYKSIPERLNERTDTNFDYISIFAGTNDWLNAENNNIPLGNITDNENSNTFYGFLYKTFNILVEKYVASNILIATPIKRNIGVLYNGKYVNSTTEGYQNTLDEYVEAIKNVASSYAFNVLDLFNISGLNPRLTNNKNYYFFDNTHPNDKGQEKLYPGFRNALLSC